MKAAAARLLAAVLAALALAGAGAVARGEPTDEEKLRIVYRMYEGYREEFPEVPDVRPPRAMALVRAGRAVLVDVRRPEEMAVSTLPGAVSRDRYLANRDAYRDKSVIAYCTVSYRSGRFAREMGREGERIANLAGGLLAWVLEGGKVYRDGKETRRIHVYGPRWNYPPRGYEAVTFGFWERLLSGD